VVIFVCLAIAVVGRSSVGWLTNEDVRLWSTLFVSICVQALPFLVLGVTISGLIAAYISPDFVQRIVPKRKYVAIPAACAAGMALPGCECGSVPIAGRLVAAGTPPAAALTFLLAAPAINPVVLISTAVAFPGNTQVVLARFVASAITAIAVGLWWSRSTHMSLIDRVHVHEGSPKRWDRFADSMARDFAHAGGYLVVGALAAATLQIVIPGRILSSVAGSEVLSVAMMATMAILLSICSEADAFVAAGLPQFSITSRLVFMVVGPVVDLKLVAMQGGIFGRRFATIFAPVTLAIAIASAVIVGQVLL
jgi:uncharacterized protein